MIEVFFSYAEEDKKLRDQLTEHLSSLKRERIINAWHDGEIIAGNERNKQINQHLENAKVILLLVSSSFIASDDCYEIELKRAIERHKAKDARVIPVILRPVDWKNTLFGEFQALPSNNKPVTSWENPDEAFIDIVKGIRFAIEELTGQKTNKKFSGLSPGAPFQAPHLSSYFVERPEVSKELKKCLLSQEVDKAGTLVISAIYGLGGIGKSTLATALAYDQEIQSYFSDGILWATLGQQPDILSFLYSWIQALGDYNFKPTNPESASLHLRTLLADKKALLVVDDLWNSDDVDPFLVAGDGCRVLMGYGQDTCKMGHSVNFSNKPCIYSLTNIA